MFYRDFYVDLNGKKRNSNGMILIVAFLLTVPIISAFNDNNDAVYAATSIFALFGSIWWLMRKIEDRRALKHS